MTVRWSVCSAIRPCWHCIASRPVASPDAALPPCRHPRTVRRGAGHQGNGRRIFRSPRALCPGGRWSRDQRCEMHDDGSVTLPIRAHNEAKCLSRVLGFADRAQVWPRTGCAGRSKKRSMPWPVCTTRRANRQTRPKAAARLPRPAPCGCGSNPRCRTCVHPYRMFLSLSGTSSWPTPFASTQVSVSPYSTFAPAPEGPLGYPCSALP